MGRTNMEDSLITDGHLHKLAKGMGWDEDKAAGRLYFFYRHTQKEGIVTDTPSRIASAVLVRFDSEEQVVAWLEAMAAALLAVKNEDGTFRIRGNEKHVARIANLNKTAKNGGLARQRQLREKRNDSQAVTQPFGSTSAPEVSDSGALLAPGSLLPSSSPRERVSEGDTPPPPVGDRLYEIQASSVSTADAKAVAEVYQRWLVERRKFAPVIDVKPMDVHHAKLIIAKAGGDVAQAKKIVACYVDQDRKFYADVRWPLSLLSRPDTIDFEKINGIVREAIGAKNLKQKEKTDE